MSSFVDFVATWFPSGFFGLLFVGAVLRRRDRRRDPRRNYYAESEVEGE